MIANAAFLAAVTLFLLLAWLAGELGLPRAVQSLPVPPARLVHGRGGAHRVLQPVRPTTAWRGGYSFETRPQTPAPRPATGYV